MLLSKHHRTICQLHNWWLHKEIWQTCTIFEVTSWTSFYFHSILFVCVISQMHYNSFNLMIQWAKVCKCCYRNIMGPFVSYHIETIIHYIWINDLDIISFSFSFTCSHPYPIVLYLFQHNVSRCCSRNNMGTIY